VLRHAALLLLLAAPAAGQTVEHCRALWVGHAGAMALAGLGERPPAEVGVEGGWCVARGLAADPFGDGRGVLYPRVAWAAGQAADGGASFAVELEAVPAGISPLPGRSASFRDRAALSLALGEDAAAGMLSVRFGIAFEGMNGLSAELRAPGLTAAGVVPLPVRLATAELRSFSAGIESDGRLAERWAALFPPLEPPGAADRAQAAAVIRGLPAGAMDAASREAALALMNDWPDLRGRASIELDAPEGFRPFALAGLGVAPDPARWLGATLAGASLRVAYRP
jgi:hypothetical protein